MSSANAFAQYMLELINQFRLDPKGEFGRMGIGTKGKLAHDENSAAALDYFDVDLGMLRKELSDLDPVQPLAWDGRLADAARGHSKLLKETDSQSHQVVSEGEPPLIVRVVDEGYDPVLVGENVYSYAQSVRHAQDGFIIDWGPGPDGMQAGRGHRANLIDGDFREIGIGVEKDTSSSTAVGKYVVTQNLGTEAGGSTFLLGVAYKDRDGDDFYSMGDGLDGLKVEVQGAGRSRGADAGGYAIAVEPGDLKVEFFGGAVDKRIVARVDFGDGNVKIDVVDRKHLLTSADLELKEGAGSVRAIGVDDIDLSGRGGGDRLYGNDGRNRLEGEGGGDKLSGAGSGDRLIGGRGNDKLDGDGGRDKLFGGDGRDRLTGGSGSDKLFGGEDRDVFVFGDDDGRDRIGDWDKGDEILLRGGRKSDVDIRSDDGDAVIKFHDTKIIVKGEAGDIGFGDIDFA